MRRIDTRKKQAWVVCMSSLALGLGSAPAVMADPFYVIDTGPGRSNAQAGDLTLTATQYQAAEFTLVADATVTDIEGWLAYLSPLGDLPVELVVYGDAGDVPDLTESYWRQLFSVSGGIGFPGDWYGVSGISLDLDAGTYWVAFEVPTGSFGTGVVPPTPAQELDNYALGNPTTGYAGDDTLNLGLRIGVPEPHLLVQIYAGVFALLGLRRPSSVTRLSRSPTSSGPFCIRSPDESG